MHLSEMIVTAAATHPLPTMNEHFPQYTVRYSTVHGKISARVHLPDCLKCTCSGGLCGFLPAQHFTLDCIKKLANDMKQMIFEVVLGSQAFAESAKITA